MHFFKSSPLTILFYVLHCVNLLSLFTLLCVSLQELERFKAFVKRKPAFDVVIDGLNVANAKRGKLWQSEMVRKLTDAYEMLAQYFAASTSLTLLVQNTLHMHTQSLTV